MGSRIQNPESRIMERGGLHGATSTIGAEDRRIEDGKKGLKSAALISLIMCSSLDDDD